MFAGLSASSAESWVVTDTNPVTDSVSFDESLSADQLVTWYELEKLAASENRIVLQDCNTGGIRDNIAAWIPESGLSFVLKPKENRRVFIYIDFVGIVDQRMEPIADDLRCRPSRRETVLPTSRPGPYEWVEVFVNDNRKAIVYQGRDLGVTGPVAVPVSRDEFRKGLVSIRLVPSGRMQAVWDVFLSHSPPEE